MLPRKALAFRGIGILCVCISSLQRDIATSAVAALHKGGAFADTITVELPEEVGEEEDDIEVQSAAMLQMNANGTMYDPIEIPADCDQVDAFFVKKKTLKKGLGTKRVTIAGNKIVTKSVPFVPCTQSTLYNYCVQNELRPHESEYRCRERMGMEEMEMILDCARLGFALVLKESIATRETVEAMRQVLTAVGATRVQITGLAGQKDNRMPSENTVPAWIELAQARARAMEGHLNIDGIVYEEPIGAVGKPSIEITVVRAGQTSMENLMAAPKKEECVEMQCAKAKKELHLDIEEFSKKSSDLRVELTMWQTQTDTCVEAEKECLAQARVINGNARTSIQEVEKAQRLQKERFERIEKEKDEKYAILLLEEISQIKSSHTSSLAALKESHTELIDAEVRKKDECMDKKLKTQVILEKEKTEVIRLREEAEAMHVRYQTCQEQQALKLNDKETIKLLGTGVEREFSECTAEVSGLERQLQEIREENEKQYKEEMEWLREMEESYNEKVAKLTEETEKLSREREGMLKEIRRYIYVMKTCTDGKDDCEEQKKICKEAAVPCPPTPAPTPPPPSYRGVTTTTTTSTLPPPPFRKTGQACAIGGGYMYCEECPESQDELWCRTASDKAAMEATMGQAIYNHFRCMRVCNCWEIDNNAAGRSSGAQGTAEIGGGRSKWTRFTYGFSKYTCRKAFTPREYELLEQDDPNAQQERSLSLGTYAASIKRRKAHTPMWGSNGWTPAFKAKKEPTRR